MLFPHTRLDNRKLRTFVCHFKSGFYGFLFYLEISSRTPFRARPNRFQVHRCGPCCGLQTSALGRAPASRRGPHREDFSDLHPDNRSDSRTQTEAAPYERLPRYRAPNKLHERSYNHPIAGTAQSGAALEIIQGIYRVTKTPAQPDTTLTILKSAPEHSAPGPFDTALHLNSHDPVACIVPSRHPQTSLRQRETTATIWLGISPAIPHHWPSRTDGNA